jgi:hypothetical protein
MLTFQSRQHRGVSVSSNFVQRHPCTGSSNYVGVGCIRKNKQGGEDSIQLDALRMSKYEYAP